MTVGTVDSEAQAQQAFYFMKLFEMKLKLCKRMDSRWTQLSSK